VSSALATKPRPSDSATSGPKSAPSLVDARTIAAAELAPQPRRDLEPVDVRQLDVEEHDIWFEAERLGESRLAVARGSDEGEAVGLQHPPCDGPERRVVVDDQDRWRRLEQPHSAGRLVDHGLRTHRRCCAAAFRVGAPRLNSGPLVPRRNPAAHDPRHHAATNASIHAGLRAITVPRAACLRRQGLRRLTAIGLRAGGPAAFSTEGHWTEGASPALYGLGAERPPCQHRLRRSL
jgi:hypothetical protein